MDNQIQKDLSAYKINDICDALYRYREINADFNNYFKFFVDRYYNSETWSDKSICIYLSNNFINKIFVNKIYSSYPCHGRSKSKNVNLTPFDLNSVCSKMNEWTISRADGILDRVLLLALNNQNSEIKINRINKNEIIFNDNDIKVKVPINFIKKVIEISHAYFDVLYSDDMWEANSEILKPEYKNYCFFLFKYINTSEYLNIEILKKEAQERVELTNKKMNYAMLVAAVANNDTEGVEQYIKYLNDKEILSNYEELWYYPIYKKNIKIIKLLIKAGYKFDGFFYDYNKEYDALTFAYERKFEKAIELFKENYSNFNDEDCRLLLKNKNYDLLEYFIKKGYHFYPSKSFAKVPFEIIKKYSNNYNISWLKEHLELAYKKDKSTFVNMLTALQNKYKDENYEEYDLSLKKDIYSPEYYQLGAFKFVYSLNDFELLEFVLNLDYSFDDGEFDECIDPIDFFKEDQKHLNLLDKIKDTNNNMLNISNGIYLAIESHNIDLIKKHQDYFNIPITFKNLYDSIYLADDSKESFDVFLYFLENLSDEEIKKNINEKSKYYTNPVEKMYFETFRYCPKTLSYLLPKFDINKLSFGVVSDFAERYYETKSEYLEQYKDLFVELLHKFTKQIIDADDNNKNSVDSVNLQYDYVHKAYVQLNIINDPLYAELLDCFEKNVSEMKEWAKIILSFSYNFLVRVSTDFNDTINFHKFKCIDFIKPKSDKIKEKYESFYFTAKKYLEEFGNEKFNYAVDDCKIIINNFDEIDLLNKL